MEEEVVRCKKEVFGGSTRVAAILASRAALLGTAKNQ